MGVSLVPNSNGEGTARWLSEEQWIQAMHMKKGALHADLGIPQGKKIPLGMIRDATHSKNPTLRKRAYLALTLRGITRRHANKVRAEKAAAEE